MAQTEEQNRGRHEKRRLRSLPVTPEQVGFPAAAQAAQLTRQTSGRKPETVYLLTSREGERLTAPQWLNGNRQYWGVENGTHQRLDVTANEDRCRVRNRNGVWVLGMFRRIAISLFVEWRSRDPKRKWKTLTDFYTAMDCENRRHGVLLTTAKKPSLEAAS